MHPSLLRRVLVIFALAFTHGGILTASTETIVIEGLQLKGSTNKNTKHLEKKKQSPGKTKRNIKRLTTGKSAHTIASLKKKYAEAAMHKKYGKHSGYKKLYNDSTPNARARAYLYALQQERVMVKSKLKKGSYRSREDDKLKEETLSFLITENAEGLKKHEKKTQKNSAAQTKSSLPGLPPYADASPPYSEKPLPGHRTLP